MKLSLLNQYAGVIVLSMNSVYFNLDEVIFFLKDGEFSFFDFYSDYSDGLYERNRLSLYLQCIR